jgi:hypothetical protein
MPGLEFLKLLLTEVKITAFSTHAEVIFKITVNSNRVKQFW